MTRNGGLGGQEAIVSEAEHLLRRWRFAANAAGALWIQPIGPTLSHEELGEFLERLRRDGVEVRLGEIVFDLSRIETIGPHWTTVLALLIKFARDVTVRCRVVSFHGQPAGVVGLYHRNREVAALVTDRGESSGNRVVDTRTGRCEMPVWGGHQPRSEPANSVVCASHQVQRSHLPGVNPQTTRRNEMFHQPMVMKHRHSILRILFGVILTTASGCQHYAKITWDTPSPVLVEEQTPLAVDDLAELKRDGGIWDRHPTQAVIGKHTATIFAIPVGSINTHKSTPLKQSFAQAITDALEASGYELVAASQAPHDAPVLRGEVNACWWWSYSYLWPAIVQGGRNKVTLILESRDGKPLWKREFSRIETGITPVGAYAFDLMIKWSMTKLVQDIARECSSQEFRAALRKGRAANQTAMRQAPTNGRLAHTDG